MQIQEKFVKCIEIKKPKFEIDKVSDLYIENFIKEFISFNGAQIKILCQSAYKDRSKVSLEAFQELIKINLIKACYTFIDNSYNKNIETYLFACIHKITKDIKNEGMHSVYICPGCKSY